MKSTSEPVLLAKPHGKHLFGPYLEDVCTRNTRLEWIVVYKRDLNTRQERDAGGRSVDVRMSGVLSIQCFFVDLQCLPDNGRRTYFELAFAIYSVAPET